MKNEFISHSLALELKELGFDEPCFGYYSKDNILAQSNWSYLESRYKCYYIYGGILAPLYSQVFQWFENKKDLFVTINCTNTKYKDSWEYEISSQNDRMARRFVQPCTHREIEIACIEMLIDIVKDHNKMLNSAIESVTGYSCPNCGAICTEDTLISKTEAEFLEEPDPHYAWLEYHKCQKCESFYIINNAT